MRSHGTSRQEKKLTPLKARRHRTSREEAAMRKIRCNECGNENEVPDEGDLPRCEACDQSLQHRYMAR